VRRASPTDPEFRKAIIDGSFIVDNIGVVPALTGEAVGPEMADYAAALGKVG
jgi:hypothetical protein